MPAVLTCHRDTWNLVYYHFLVPHVMGIHRIGSISTVLNVNIHNQLFQSCQLNW